jgi:long-chain acyl-CoA synthetase
LQFSSELGYGHVGTPMGGFDIRLINWEEGNYRVTNKPHPQGEIIVGGGNVAIGYFKHPEKTAEEFFDEDGKRWFKTGDIGELLPDGNVKIIDRRKDLIKLAHGEYVSLGKVEAEIKTSSLVDNICVYADPEKTYVVALVSPNEKNLVELALSIGIEENFKDLCENSKITLKLEEVFREILRNCGFAKYEIPKRITLCKEIWTPDSGLVTAAFKIRRKQIQERYQDDITRMYSVKH